MKNKKHIAMRCNKEQFEAIKPKLEGKVKFDTYFKEWDIEYPYLTNYYGDKKKSIGWRNLDLITKEEIHEEWNEKIFLEACGIELEPKFEITKEAVIKYQMKEEFPEVFEVKLPDDFTGWVLDEESPKIIAYSKKGFLKYGFNFYGKWIENTNTKIKHERKATPEEVTEALKKEAVSLGLVVGNYALFGEIKEARRISEEIIWNERHNCLCSGQNVLMNSSGKWATVIQTKTIQQAEELLKELGHEIKIV